MNLFDTVLKELRNEYPAEIEIETSGIDIMGTFIEAALGKPSKNEEAYNIRVQNKSETFMHVMVLIASNTDNEDAYLTFILPLALEETEPIPHKYKIRSICQKPDEYEVEQCQAAENIFRNIKKPLQPGTHKAAELKDCLKSAIIQWLGLKEK